MENQQPWDTAKREREAQGNGQPWKTAKLEREQVETAAPVESGFGRAFAQGLTDYTSDEAEGFVLSNLPDAITGNPQTYQQARDKVREGLKAYSKQNPKTAFSGEMLGAITQGIIESLVRRNPAPLVEGAMGVIKRNALQGARAAVGESEADLTEGDIAGLATDTAKGGLYGTAIGVPLERAMSGAGGVIKKYGGNLVESMTRKGKGITALQNQLNISSGAAAVIYTMLVQNMNLQQMTTALNKAGDDGMIIDADKSIAALGDAIQNSGTPNAGQIIGDAAETRASNQAETLRPIMDEVLGEPPVGMQTAVEAVAKRTEPARKKAYNDAYKQKIDYDSPAGTEIAQIVDDLGTLDPKELRNAVKRANMRMSREGYRDEQFVMETLEDGTVRLKKMPNMIQVDYLKRQLDKTYDRTGIEEYALFATDLRNAAVDAVPKYGVALKLGGAKITETEVMKLGGKFLNDNVAFDTLLNAVNNATDADMQAVRLGARSQIESILDQTKKNIGGVADDKSGATFEESRKLLRVLSTKANRKKLSLILGEDQAAALFKSLDEVTSGLQLLNGLSGNSKTAVRKQLNDTIDDILAPGVIMTAARGELTDIPKKLVQLITQQTPEALTDKKDEILSEVARVLTQSRGREAQEALRLMDKVREGAKLSPAQAAFVKNTYELANRASTGFSAGFTQGARQQTVEADPAQALY